jgi:site-specific DNA recombinase
LPNILKAGIYTRVSTEEQRKKGYSLAEQAEACRKKALDMGADEIELFEDPDESGKFIDRPALTRLFTAVKNRDIDIVVVLDPDRLARNIGVQVLAVELIEADAKLVFVTFERGDKENAEANLFLNIKGSFSEYERVKIGQRMMAGKRQKALQGKIVVPGGWSGHPGAFGYTYVKNGKDSHLEINPREAGIVKHIFELAYDQKFGIRKITDSLNQENIPAPRGGVWHSSTVGRILKSELYIGIFYNFKFKTTVTDKRTPSGKRQHTFRLRSESERIPVQVPALIERKIFDVVQTRMHEYGLQNKKLHTPVLLKGRVRCGLCGRICSVECTQGNSYYRCKGTKTGFMPRCTVTSIPVFNSKKNYGIDEIVWSSVVKMLSDPALIKKQLKSFDSGQTLNKTREERNKLKSKLKTITKQKDELLNLRLESLLTPDELKKQLIKIEQKRKEITLNIIEKENSLAEIDANASFDIDAFCKFFQTRIENAGVEEKIQVIRDLDITVKIYEDRKIEIIWPFGGQQTISTLTIPSLPPIISHKQYSLTSETWQLLSAQTKQRGDAAELIREAIMAVPDDAVYVRDERSKRHNSCVCLPQMELDKLNFLMDKYNESALRMLGWVIDRYIRPD